MKIGEENKKDHVKMKDEEWRGIIKRCKIRRK
jgi:hypothetical protein